MHATGWWSPVGERNQPLCRSRRMHLGRKRSLSFRSGVAASTLLSDARGCLRTILLTTMGGSEVAWMVRVKICRSGWLWILVTTLVLALGGAEPMGPELVDYSPEAPSRVFKMAATPP